MGAVEGSGRRPALRAFLGLAALVSFAPPARGAPSGEGALPQLSVARPADAVGCPDAASVASTLRSMAGRDVVTIDPSASADERWFVEVRREAAGYGAVVRVEGSRAGERRLSTPGASCDELREAVAVTIALVLDHALVLDASPAPEGAPVPAMSPQGGRAAASPRRPWRGLVEGRVGGEVGLLKGVGGLGALGVELSPPPWQWAFGAGLFGVTPSTVADNDGEVKLSLWGGYLRACRAIVGAPGALQGSLCALGAGGILGGAGRGYPGGNRGERQPWVSAGLAARARGPLGGPFGWMVTATGYAPLVRGGFSVGGRGEVYEPSAVAFSLDAGLSWSIW